jgi:hypothetical protein
LFLHAFVVLLASAITLVIDPIPDFRAAVLCLGSAVLCGGSAVFGGCAAVGCVCFAVFGGCAAVGCVCFAITRGGLSTTRLVSPVLGSPFPLGFVRHRSSS